MEKFILVSVYEGGISISKYSTHEEAYEAMCNALAEVMGETVDFVHRFREMCDECEDLPSYDDGFITYDSAYISKYGNNFDMKIFEI